MSIIERKRKYGKEFWKEYLDNLYSLNEILELNLNEYVKHIFKRDIEIKISENFDLLSFLRSFKVKSELVWPNSDGLNKQYKLFQEGKCRKLDFKLYCKSLNKNSSETYSIILSYEPYKFKDERIVFFPFEVVHWCKRNEFSYISLGHLPVFCKHVYSAMRKVAEECEKRKIPIDTTILSPIPSYIWDVLRLIENRKIPIIERARYAYFKLIGYIYLDPFNPVTQNFVWSIIRTIKTIKYIISK